MSPTDPAKRMPFEDAVNAIERRADLAGIGIVLTGEPCYGGKYLVALDLDNVEDGMGDSAAQELWIALGQPYVERSPSGKGLRMLALSDLPLAREGNAGQGREIYMSKRYVTITGNKHAGKSNVPGKLKDCTIGLQQMVKDWWPSSALHTMSLQVVTGAETDATTNALLDTPETPEAVSRVKAMLAVVSADCTYERWRSVVWSLLSTAWSCAEDIARKWSQLASDRFDATAFDLLVSSYKPGHITLGTLVHIAREAGWREGVALPATESVREYAPGRLLTLDQLLTIKPEPYRVRGVLPARGLAAIYGASGSGKSFLALDLAMSVCMGASHWFQNKLRSAPVVYVALEGQAGMVNRVKAWQQVNKAAAIDQRIRFLLGDFQLTRGETVGRLQAEIAALVGPGAVVVVDTLNQASPGADENSSAEMGTVIGHANAMAQTLDALVILIHHSGKDAARGMRGHSSLFAAMDGVIEVVQDPKNGQRSWRVAKAKDDALGGPNYFELVGVPLGTDAEGDPIGSCAVRHVFTLPTPDNRRAPTGKRQAAAWQAIEQTGRIHFSRAALEDLIKPTMNTDPGRQLSAARDVIKSLEAAGHLREDEGGFSLY